MAATETGGGATALRKLSRLRRGSIDKNGSTVSLRNSTASDGGDPAAKPSTESPLDLIRSKTRRKSTHEDERRGSGDSGGRLSKLLPGKRGRLKKTPSSDKLERPVSAYSTTSNGLPGNQSDSSIGANGSGHSSLLTDDNSEHEG